MAVDNSLVEKSMRSVFVGNIPYDMTDERLKEIFSQVGPVLSFRMMTDRSTGKPKGYGFCEFRDPETALSAMRNLNGFEIGGRSLRVDNACTEKSRMEMQTLMQGPAHDSPYGDEVEPTEAPEAITKAVASLPPEQMFELMKQMKMCIQNNPTEARTMLLQNPQLAYALLQAQVVMRIVDPQAAAAMLHKSQPGPSVMQPSEEPPAGGRPELASAPLPVPAPPAATLLPPSAQQQQPAPVPAPPLRDGPFGSMPGQDVDFRRGGGGPMGGDMDLRNMDHRGMTPRQGDQDHRGMAPRQGDQDHRGMAPRQGDQDHRGMAPRQGDQDHRGMAPRQGDQDHRGMAPRQGDQDHRSMAPRQGDQDLRMPPRDMRRPIGPPSGSRVDVDLRAADRDMRGPPPQDYDARSYGRDIRAPMGGYGGPPRGFGGAGMDGMGGGGGPPSSRGDMRDPRMPSQSLDRDMRGGGRGPAAPPSSGAPSVSDIDVGLSASLAGGDQEKAALIMQVLQLSDEQVAMLPAEQRQSITLLKQQISAAKQKGR